MTNAGRSGRNHHSCVCESTMREVDIDPAMRKTETSERPIASS